MKRAEFTEERILAVSKEHEARAKTAELARKPGFPRRRSKIGKAKFGGMDVFEPKRLRALEEENAKLKNLPTE